MNRSALAALMALTLIAAASCGGKTENSSSASSGGSNASSGSSASISAVAATSKYDAGPRAGESRIDEAMAEKGAGLFKTKGCSACHAFGKRLTCPDLAGVSMRRTAQWMENQILHPDVMVKEDPISHGLFAQFALQMPNQGLTADETHQVIEYFKHMDHEAGEAKH
jgi:cytochrome c551/c552